MVRRGQVGKETPSWAHSWHALVPNRCAHLPFGTCSSSAAWARRHISSAWLIHPERGLFSSSLRSPADGKQEQELHKAQPAALLTMSLLSNRQCKQQYCYLLSTTIRLAFYSSSSQMHIDMLKDKARCKEGPVPGSLTWTQAEGRR